MSFAACLLKIQKRARAKIIAIDAASQLDDLRIPPGNRLEAFRGDRKGQHSVRVAGRNKADCDPEELAATEWLLFFGREQCRRIP